MEYNKVYLTLDIKSIVIILLSLLVVGLIFFNNSGKDIKKYEQEIGNLNTKNKELLLDKDSIKNLNLVLSKDINSNILSYNKVLNSAMTMENAEIMEIENTESGFKIRCTPNHQIFTKNRGYVEAKDLKEMDVLDILP